MNHGRDKGIVVLVLRLDAHKNYKESKFLSSLV